MKVSYVKQVRGEIVMCLVVNEQRPPFIRSIDEILRFDIESSKGNHTAASQNYRVRCCCNFVE